MKVMENENSLKVQHIMQDKNKSASVNSSHVVLNFTMFAQN